MPIAERGILNLRVINGNGQPVDTLMLKWPAVGNEWHLALPVRVCATGLILALPKGALTDEDLEAGHAADPDALVGPSHEVRVSLTETPDVEVDVVLVEFAMAIRLQLENRTARSRRVVNAFTEQTRDLQMPNIAELDEHMVAWLETGALRTDDFQTAAEGPLEAEDRDSRLLQEISKLQTMMDRRLRLMENQIHDLQDRQPRPADNPPKPKTQQQPGGALPQKSGVREEEISEAVEAASRYLKPRPKAMPDQPGRTLETFVDTPQLEEVDAASVDDLMKLSMLKLMKDLQQKQTKTKSKKKLPGLTFWEDSESSQDESVGWSSSSKGGRGIEAVEKVKHAMKGHPEAYQERMEQRMLKACDATEMTPSIPLQFVKGSPVGKSRTAGYCLQGFAEVHRLLLESKPKQARLHVLRMMAALEQFLIDESWVVASRLTCTEEPPWGHWATQDVGAIRRQLVYNRLSESTWVAAVINQLKEEEWLTKKRTGLNAKGNGKGKDKDKDNAT